MKKLYSLVAALLLTTGCGVLHGAVPVLDAITAAIVDVDNIVDAIDSVAPQILAQEHATDAQVTAYHKAVSAFHLAVEGIQKTDAAAKNLDAKDVDAAMVNIAKAWDAYVSACAAVGINVQAVRSGAQAPKATAGMVVVPEPMAVRAESGK